MVERSRLFYDLRDLFNRHDPVGLIGLGAPPDEYHPEVGTVLSRLAGVTRSDEVERILEEEFARWFSPDMSFRNLPALAVVVYARYAQGP